MRGGERSYLNQIKKTLTKEVVSDFSFLIVAMEKSFTPVIFPFIHVTKHLSCEPGKQQP